MKRIVFGLGLLLLGIGIGFGIAWLLPARQTQPAAANRETVTITLSATVDGSDRFIFTRDNVWNEHGRWQPPRDILFNNEPWSDLSDAPPGWEQLAANLDLTQAELVQRKGRDMIALERTPDGFDLYFADTQMGSASYQATIAIPKK